MASAVVEEKVFTAFLGVAPPLASVALTWDAGANPPDFLGIGDDGTRVGIELTEWLDEDQIARERPQYAREATFLRAIDSRSVPPPVNIGSVWLFEREALRPADAAAFRAELYACIGALDAAWLTHDDHDDPQGVDMHEFSGYPTVAKYLVAMSCWSQARHPSTLGVEWIVFMNHGGAYSPTTARDAAETSLRRKTAKYATLKADQDLTALHLLLYYDQGFHYNTPFDAPGVGFADVAAYLRDVAANDHGAFDRIFLFVVATNDLAQLYP